MSPAEPTAVVASRAPRIAFGAACAAPFTTLHLDPHGFARVCCENRMHVVGDVTSASLAEIWSGAPLARLRRAMEVGDLELGCEGCRSGLATGARPTTRAGLYDHLTVVDGAPSRPVRLELELSNTCNLQCVMCNGELSSAIRSRREHRPPLPKIYGDAFFDQLAALAPHLHEVLFLGGEPFLGSEPLRAFDVLRRHGFTGRCHVTTNGTVVGDRVAAILDDLLVDVSISVDGATAATVESIRQGVDHRRLLDNVVWFREVARRRGTTLALHYCLMQSNWHELHEFMTWADDLDVDVIVLPVRHPMSMNVDQLPARELAAIADTMRRSGEAAPLRRNAAAWAVQVARLESLAGRERGEGAVVVNVRGAGGRPASPGDTLAAWAGSSDVTTLLVDTDGIVTDISPDPTDVFGMDLLGFVGEHSQELLAALRNRFGDLTRTQLLDSAPGTEDHVLGFDGASGPVEVRAVLLAPTPTEPGRWYLARRAVPAAGNP